MSIVISQLSQEYRSKDGSSFQALANIDLKIEKNEFLAIVGPSGCGKSTLLKIMAGLVKQTGGVMVVDGKEFSGQRTDVGVVFQDARLLPWLTVVENVLLPIRVQGKSRNAARARAMELLEIAGLEGFAKRYPFELSGGMQQRVAICRALIHEPNLLLMDEPFGALDAMTRETMNTELLKIWSKNPKTVIFITHSIPEAVYLADRVAVFSSRPGRVDELITVDLPRPRDPSVMSDPRFVEICAHLRAKFSSSSDFH